MKTAKGWTFTRRWKSADRTVPVKASYSHGDSDIPPYLDLPLDGKSPVRLQIGKLNKTGMGFIPGSYGPEALVLPNGKEIWANGSITEIPHPQSRYIMIRGGGSICKALMVAWDTQPDRICVNKVKGGRYGSLISSIELEFSGKSKSTARVYIMPFDGYADSLKTPRAIAENVVRTGTLGCNGFDPVSNANSASLGPNGLSAAAYLFRKYGLPEAKEAEDLALKCMDSMIVWENAGTRTWRPWHLIIAADNLGDLGHPKYKSWVIKWADRIIGEQSADGSYAWHDYQWLCALGLLRAYELTGDARYKAAYDKTVSTVEYKDGSLFWKGKQTADDGFAGATAFGAFGHLGEVESAEKVLAFNSNFIDDRAFGCDLNPYMMGYSAKGMKYNTEPKIILGITEFAEYTGNTVRKLDHPTAYVVNPYHPFSKGIDFRLP